MPREDAAVPVSPGRGLLVSASDSYLPFHPVNFGIECEESLSCAHFTIRASTCFRFQGSFPLARPRAAEGAGAAGLLKCSVESMKAAPRSVKGPDGGPPTPQSW